LGSGNVFGPVTEAPGSNVKTVSLMSGQDGTAKFLRGSAGTFVVNMEAGKVISFDWTFTGIYASTADQGLLAPTYPTDTPIMFSGATVTLATVSTSCAAMSIDAGNAVDMIEDATDPSGYKYAFIGGRRITGSINPESATTKSKLRLDNLLARVESALVVEAGTSLDQLTIDAPKLQWTGMDEEDDAGLQRDAMPFQLNRSASAGNDDLTFTFS
jgi:hypothetical protein